MYQALFVSAQLVVYTIVIGCEFPVVPSGDSALCVPMGQRVSWRCVFRWDNIDFHNAIVIGCETQHCPGRTHSAGRGLIYPNEQCTAAPVMVYHTPMNSAVCSDGTTSTFTMPLLLAVKLNVVPAGHTAPVIQRCTTNISGVDD
jgi:hypothetical protein